MKTSTKRILSMLVAIVMAIGLMAPTMAATPILGEVAETPAVEAETPATGHSSGRSNTAQLSADTVTYTFTASEMAEVEHATDAYADNEQVTAEEMASLFDGFFSITGTVKKRAAKPQKNDSDGNPSVAESDLDYSVKSVELAKAGGGSIDFTITGTAVVTVSACSTGGNNDSDAVLYKVAGTTNTAMTEKNNTTVVSGTGENELIYEDLEAGDYSFESDGGSNTSRGVRVYTITVVETGGTGVVEREPHDITVAAAENGTVSVDVASAKKGETVTVTATPDEGYQVKSMTATGTSGATATFSGATFTMLDEAVTVTVEFELKPVVAENAWVPTLDNIPGGTGVNDTYPDTALTSETLVTDEVEGVKFYVGPTKYKYQSGDPAGMYGNDNSELKATTGYARPTTGTYFKFVIEKDGILKLTVKYGNCNTDSKRYYIGNGDTVLPDYDAMATESETKTETLSVKAGDEIYLVGASTKPGFAGFEFTVMESTSGSWVPTLDNIPGGTGVNDTYPDTALTSETLVTDEVEGVKFYVGPTKYKYQSGDPAGMYGNDNSELKATTGYARPTTGTYFKFVIEKDGVLKLTVKYGNCNTDSKRYYIGNGDTVLPDYDAMATESETKTETLSVKAGDEIYLVGASTKPGFAGFEFTSGGVTESTSDWTEEAIFATTPTMTATADNTKGTITVAVTGVRVGKILDGSDMITYADNVAVTMVKNGEDVATETSTTAGTQQSIKFTPTSSGTYTFRLVAQRTGKQDLESTATASADFILPFGTPAISSASSNGAGSNGLVSVNVMWGAVTEAESYKVFVKETSATTWPTDAAATVTAVDGKATYSQNITGLTAGIYYDFKVTATRGTETTTSDPKTAVAEATKVIAWTEVTFGTSSTDLSNSVIGGPVDQKSPLDEYPDSGKTAYVKTDGQGSYYMKFVDNPINPAEYRYTGLTGDLNTDPGEDGVANGATTTAGTAASESTTKWGDARVLLSSRNGAGKIKEDEGADGLLYYYTAVPAGTNYTLRADVKVLRWATSNTQNGVGLVAMDRVPSESWTNSSSGNSDNYWDNIYLVGAARNAFSYDSGEGVAYSDKDASYDSYTKYSYYMGLISVAKYGVPVNTDGSAYDGSSNPTYYYERRFPLDLRIPRDGRKVTDPSSNRFNVIGNYSVKPAGFSQLHDNGSFMADYELTDFTLEIQKNNTGYISTAYIKNADGTLKQLGQNIDYFVKGAMDLSGTAYHDDDTSGRKDIDSLQCLDSDYEYVGLFTAREMDALFTNVQLTTIAAEDDAAAVLPPTTYITPTMSITSGDYSNSENFNLSVYSNVAGTFTVKQNGTTLPDTYKFDYNDAGTTERMDIPVTLKTGSNSFSVTFQPDPNQELAAFTELKNSDAITKTSQVIYETFFSSLNNIYVSPTGKANNYGTKNSPVDVYTAVSAAQPGQNIILLAGEYKLTQPIKINRGMDGTEDERIYFFADPDRAEGEKVVLNGQKTVGTILTAGSNYWVFKDFEVVGSTGTAFLVAGSYNVVQNVKTHDNLSSGLAISRLSSTDRVPVRPTEDKIDGDLEITDWGDWPCYNLIINCESYRNYDAGYDGADGFCAKETCGTGNVFDGCAAYWNADDGWDFYAKTSTDKGPLGRTTIRNCVSFQNGYEVRKLADVTNVVPEYEDDGYNAKMNLEDGKVVLQEAGNGNGFKMGGSHLPGAHRIENSYAFGNKAKGFDSNNGPDIKIVGCTAYNNAQENVGLGSSWSVRNYLVSNTISFKDENAPTYEDQSKGTIEQMADATPLKTGDTTYYDQATFFTWTSDKKSVNLAGTDTVTKSDFVSLEFNSAEWADGAIRDADGSLDLGDFLKLTSAAEAKNAGAGDLVNGKTAYSDTTEGHPDVETKPVETPDIVADPEPSTNAGSSGGSSGGSGGGGTVGTTGSTTTPTTPDDTGSTGTTVSGFEDVTTADWFADAVEFVVDKGLFKGVSETSFAPNDNLTRAMLATVLYRLAGEPEVDAAADMAGYADMDTIPDWAEVAMRWAVENGTMNGMGDGILAPLGNITREQLATMLYRYIGSPEVDAAADMAGYADVDAISEWAEVSVRWAVENGIIQGKGNGTLDPQGNATRAEVATMLQRFANLEK